MRVFIATVLGLFWFIGSANANIVQIDLTGLGTNTFFAGPCYCFTSRYYSPVITVAPGDTVDFGHVELHSFQSGLTPDAGPNQQFLYLISGVSVSTNPLLPPDPYSILSFTLCNQSDATCITNARSLVTSVDLKFETQTGSIQIGWVSNGQYTPPFAVAAVPEPSTWAMLLIGFAGIGFLTGRRKKMVLNGQKSRSIAC